MTELQAGYGGYANPEPRTLSIVSLVLGTVSLFLGFTFLLPIVLAFGGFVLAALGIAGASG